MIHTDKGSRRGGVAVVTPSLPALASRRGVSSARGGNGGEVASVKAVLGVAGVLDVAATKQTGRIDKNKKKERKNEDTKYGEYFDKIRGKQESMINDQSVYQPINPSIN
jgi:hypothetical protein